MLTLTVDVSGAIEKLDTIATSADDLSPAMKTFGEYMKRRALERYRQQDFEPLKEGTIGNRAAKGLASMESKLRGDLKKAIKRGGGQRPPRSLLERVFGGAGQRGVDTVLGSSSRGAKNRLAVLVEFTQKHRQGKNRLEAAAGAKGLTLKQQQSLAVRTVRAVSKSVSRPILGRLPETLEVQVNGSTMTLASRTGKHWTAIHNEGGRAGRGADIPARPTIFVEQSDLDVLISLLKSHMLMGVEPGTHGPAF
jgi:phage gpG-like protein